MSAVMLRPGSAFPRWLALVGLATHGLDLLHGPLALIRPRLGSGLMMIAGPFYLLWFPAVGACLWKAA